MAMDIIESLAIILLSSLAASSGMFAWKLICADGIEFERNRSRISGLLEPISGKIASKHEGSRDHRVAAGISVKVSEGGSIKWIEQGRLSEEAITLSLR